MKILQLIQRPQLRGAEVFACQLSEELEKKRVKVDIVYLFEHPDMLPFKLNFISLGAKSKQRLWDFAAYRRLRNIILEGRYDIVQANAGDTLKYAALSKVIYGWKTPLVFRNANKMSDFLQNKWHFKLNRWLLSKCDYFISVSDNCRQDLISIFQPALKKSETITIGTQDFQSISGVDADGERPLLINIGGLVPEKNQMFLLEIFKLFSQKHKGRLLIIGEGKLRRLLEEKIRNLNLQDKVVILSPTKEVIAILKSADALIMPSKIEGLPAVILEALSCGIPVVASDVGGIPEVIKDEETGFIVHGWNGADYVKKLEDALFNEALRRKVIQSGRELILSQFMLGFISDKFLNAYQKVSRQQH